MEIPDLVYWMIGLLVVTNLGTIGSVIYFGGKVVWWASAIDQRMKYAEDEISTLRQLILERS